MRTRFVFLVLLLAAGLAAWATAPTSLQRALDTQRALVAKDPANPAAQIDLGNLLLLDGDEPGAEAAYREALRLSPQSTAAHYNLGLLLQRRGKTSTALDQFRAVVKLVPRHAWAQYRIGQLAEASGMRGRAVAAYARAFALDPSLRFPDVNPDVLDNHLVTESLLEAYRSYHAEAMPAVTFEEPRRIADLLVQPVRRTSAGDAAAATAEPTPTRGIHPKSKLDRPADTGGDSGAKRPDFFRVLGPADLEPGNRTGQTAAPGAPQQRGPDAGIGRQLNIEDEETPAEEPTFVPPVYAPAPPREQPRVITPGYVPMRPSSGRLELKLVLAEAPAGP